MPGGGHRFEFVGKEPPVFLAASGLLFVNTFVLLLLDFGAKYVLPKASPNSPPCEEIWGCGEFGAQLVHKGLQMGAP